MNAPDKFIAANAATGTDPRHDPTLSLIHI